MDEGKINAAERAPEPQEKTREEERPAKLEKPPKKPGSVSRFFNQFGIGKYWEKMNDYFEYEEKMEAATAEKEAKKETAEGMRSVAEEEIIYIKKQGAEMPAHIEQVAARAGAEMPAQIVAEAKVKEAKVEQEAEAAKADLGKEIDVFLAEPESLNLPSAEEIIRAHEAERAAEPEKAAKSDKLPTWEESEEADVTKEAEVKAAAIKAEELPPVEEFEEIAKVHEAKKAAAVKAEDLPPVEEFEEIDKVHEARKAATVKAVELPPAEEFETIAREHEIKAEMEKAKVEPVGLGKMKKKGKEMPEAWEKAKPAEFSAAERKKVLAGLWVPKISSGFKARLPDLADTMEAVFMAKGKEHDEKIINRMAKNLEKARTAYAAQKDAISKFDSQAFRKWVSETAGSIEVLKEAATAEIKPEKVVSLKKKKKAA